MSTFCTSLVRLKKIAAAAEPGERAHRAAAPEEICVTSIGEDMVVQFRQQSWAMCR